MEKWNKNKRALYIKEKRGREKIPRWHFVGFVTKKQYYGIPLEVRKGLKDVMKLGMVI